MLLCSPSVDLEGVCQAGQLSGKLDWFLTCRKHASVAPPPRMTVPPNGEWFTQEERKHERCLGIKFEPTHLSLLFPSQWWGQQKGEDTFPVAGLNWFRMELRVYSELATQPGRVLNWSLASNFQHEVNSSKSSSARATLIWAWRKTKRWFIIHCCPIRSFHPTQPSESQHGQKGVRG